MRLQRELSLPQAYIKPSTIGANKETDWIKVKIQAALTEDVAEAFGCRELIYAGSVPRSGVDTMKLEGGEIDCTIRFEHADMAFDAVSENMGSYVAKMEGDGPKLEFTVKLNGMAVTMSELVSKIKIDPIDITLKPAQMPLDLQAESGKQDESDRADSQDEQDDEGSEFLDRPEFSETVQ